MNEPTAACDGERLERYVAGRLGDSDRDDVEQHLLECEACTGDVELLAGMRDALERPASSRGWLMAIAAGLALAAGAAVLWTRTPAPAPPAPVATVEPASPAPLNQDAELDRLARFTPPPYVSLRTRTAESAGGRLFDTGMAQYHAGRFDEAARTLAGVVEQEPGHQAAQLFFGISTILAGRPADAVRPLARAANIDGPYAGLARLMLARAYLGTRDVAGARRELEALAATGEAQAVEARDLLTALRGR